MPRCKSCHTEEESRFEDQNDTCCVACSEDNEAEIHQVENEEEHLACQNYPNCDTEGCGPDRDVGHRD